MFATQVLPDAYFEEKTKENEEPEVVGYLTIDEKKYEVKKGENKIGRDSDCCSICIQNFTISKLHAIIESDGVDDTFIYDVGSTNQTRLGKKNLKPHCRYKIENGSVLTLGNVLAKFTTPPESGDALKSYLVTNTPPDSGENAANPADLLNELGDIFDVSTQIETPQPSCSKTILNFEKLPANFSVFKIPKPLVEPKNEPIETSQSVFDLETQCQLASRESPKPQQICYGGLEDSNIFSLTTQCQLPESPDPESTKDVELEEKQKEIDSHTPESEKNNVTSEKKKKDSDSDKIKSLLNDGHDDILCTFMSIHSPKEQKNLLKISEIKTEFTSQGNDVFDETTQLSSQHTGTNRQEIEQIKDLLANDNFGEDVCDSAENRREEDTEEETQLYDLGPAQQTKQSSQKVEPEDKKSVKPVDTKSITSDLSEKQKSSETSKPEEPADCSNVVPDKLPVSNLSQSSTESFLEITLDGVEPGEFEDPIPTQKLIKVENDKPPETESEDSGIQRENFSRIEEPNPQQGVRRNEGPKETTEPPSLIVEESSDDESYLEVSLECSTQRCDNDDLISTQLFSYEKSEGFQSKRREQSFTVESSLGRTNEDLISTQILQITPRNNSKNDIIESESPSMIERNNEDFIATQQMNETPRTISRCREISGFDMDRDGEDFIATQQLEGPSRESTRVQKRKHDFQMSCKVTLPTYTNKNSDSSFSAAERCNEDLIATQQLEVPPRRIAEQAGERVGDVDVILGSPSMVESDRDEEDLVATQQLEEPPKKIKSINCSLTPRNTRSASLSVNTPSTSGREEEDFVATQRLEEPFKKTKLSTSSEDKNYNLLEGSFSTVDRSNEDFVATQQLETPIKRKLFQNVSSTSSRKSTFGQRHDDRSNKSNSPSVRKLPSRDCSPDSLSMNRSERNVNEDIEATQIFEVGEENGKSQLIGISKSIASLLQRGTKEDDDGGCSSGDETESDLEIVEEIKFDLPKNNIKEEKESDERTTQGIENVTSHFNDSYVFQLDKQGEEEEEERQREKSSGEDKDKENWRPLTVDVLDSDATDCEEAEVVNPPFRPKEEPLERVTSEGTQVLTLSLPDDYAGRSPDSKDDWMVGDDSPKFEVWSVLTSELPNLEDVKGTRKKKSENEGEEENYETSKVGRMNEVKNKNYVRSSTKLDSPLKRGRNGDCLPDVLPVKKSRTVGNTDGSECLRSSERKFSKLWQAHDITQIQTTRMRQCRKSTEFDKVSNNSFENSPGSRASTSRKKSNPRRGSTKKQKNESTAASKSKRSGPSGWRKERAVSADDLPEEIKATGEGTTTRVLRSTRKNSGAAAPNGLRRSARTKSVGFYFRDPCVRVVFTGFDFDSLDSVITSLGGERCGDVSSGDVVVTDKVRRTVKLLSAVGLGLPVVSPEWLLRSTEEDRFLNPWTFLLKDEEAEERWDFQLKTSLERAKKKKLLEGYSVFATENTKPPVKELLSVVECCGGTPLPVRPDTWPRDTIFVSCLEDKKSWPLAKFRQVKVVHYEFILSGVLRQKLDFKTHKLR